MATEDDASTDMLLTVFLLDGRCGVHMTVTPGVVVKAAAILVATDETVGDGVRSWRDGNGGGLTA